MADRLLVIGTGLLGIKLVKLAGKELEVFAADKAPVPGIGKVLDLDITNCASCEAAILKIKPRFVVLTAALTNVDQCEREKELAYGINAEGPGNVARACRKAGAKLVYVSTDYVFDGTKGNYRETDAANPINHYGYTKLIGEKAVQEALGDSVVARTSVLYGWNPVKSNFVMWVIDSLKNGKEISVVNDQFTTPTYVGDLSEMILALMKNDCRGTYHTCGAERINRYDFAVKIADVFGLDASLIKPTTSDKLNWTAKRPMDSSLNTEKISKIKNPLDIRSGLEAMKKEQRC
ncbi:MAG: dTDP-4-dehydrorhamnose reductase [Thermoplasmata archaeon HGW-Thermoplasmata-1]|nr:MAG: dTDP-4-dehydrorhamnose reductase [Thermoplasmata archaeon HGW-Thermoplasmata-1]